MQQEPYERRVIQREIVQTPDSADEVIVDRRVHIEPSPAERQLGTLYRAKQTVWFITGLIVALIGLRFVLLLLGANVGAGFGALVLNLSQPFVAPFLPLFNEQQAQVEFSDLIAIAVYLLAGWAISKLLEIIIMPRTPTSY